MQINASHGDVSSVLLRDGELVPPRRTASLRVKHFSGQERISKRGGSLRSLPLDLMSSNAWQQPDEAREVLAKIRTKADNMVAFHKLDRIV